MAKGQLPSVNKAGLGELFARLRFVLMAIFVYRIGTHIPVPGIDPDQLAALFNQNQGTILGLANMFSGGALERMSILALGIMPYISASIIMQLLAVVIPRLQRLQDEVLALGSMVEAAQTMGAGPWTVMRTVILPSMRLPLVGSTLLLFVFLLGVYVAVTVFAEPAKQTMAVSVYEAVRGNTLNAPFGSAQAVVLLVTAGIFLALGQWISKRTV